MGSRLGDGDTGIELSGLKPFCITIMNIKKLINSAVSRLLDPRSADL